jgi:hypothetical protein
MGPGMRLAKNHIAIRGFGRFRTILQLGLRREWHSLAVGPTSKDRRARDGWNIPGGYRKMGQSAFGGTLGPPMFPAAHDGELLCLTIYDHQAMGGEPTDSERFLHESGKPLPKQSPT